MGDPNIQNEQALLANTTVFVIDDDKQTAETLRRELTQVGANVVVADSAEAAHDGFTVNDMCSSAGVLRRLESCGRPQRNERGDRCLAGQDQLA